MREYSTFDKTNFEPNEMKSAKLKMTILKANDFSNYSLFPQQVINAAYDYVDNEFFFKRPKTKFDVTVYVGPGDYYLFSCFKKFTETYACELNPDAQDWCTTLA